MLRSFNHLWLPCALFAAIVIPACGTGGGETEKDTAQEEADGGADGGATGSTDAGAQPIDVPVGIDVGCKTASDCPAAKNPCLQPVCDPGFGCKLDARPDGTDCDDGDKCTSGESCSNGACQSAAGTACDDKNDCTSDACDPATGQCVHNSKIDGAKCDDGDVCNGEADSCQAGKCTGGANVCQCDKDADCAKFDDSNPCNGALHCVVEGGVGSCKVDIKTIVVCPTKDDTTCTKSQCQPADGSCALKPVTGLVGCDDGDPCTSADQCKLGKCAGTYTCECEKDADCAKKEDGNLCNGTLKCTTNKCVVDNATIVTCTGTTTSQCTVQTCEPKTGKCGEGPVLDGNPCDDGDACWAGDTCKGGQCTKGPIKKCGCTDDSECKDDGDKCNGVPKCDPKTHECAVDPASAVSCTESDGNSCTVAGCDPSLGTCNEKPGNTGQKCDDGDACTGGETCNNGACGMSKPVTDCDDKDPCTTDACNPKTAQCEHQKIAGCGVAVQMPTEASKIFDWLVAGEYKKSFVGESKVHSGSIHAPVRAWFAPQLIQSLKDGKAQHPIGSAAVKELFNGDGKTLKGWAVNIKVDDDGQSTDWYSYEVFSTTSGANPAADGKGVPLCVSCHKFGEDFVLSKYPLL